MSRPVYIRSLRWQLGGAVTLPWCGATYIFIKPEYRGNVGLVRHEMVHAGQIQRMGPFRYLAAHLAQRMHPVYAWRRFRKGGLTEVMLARDAPLEAEAYGVAQ